MVSSSLTQLRPLRPAIRQLLLWPDTHRILTLTLIAGVFAMGVQTPFGPDTWWHLKAGQVMVESGHILQTDLFSYTRYGTHWVNHSWLSQVILYLLFSRFGYAGLRALMGAVVAVALALVYSQMEGNPFARAPVLLLAAWTAAPVWLVRPRIFSFLFTAVVYYLLYLYKWHGVNRLWLLPPLFALWVNLHAGYALGFIVLIGFIVGEMLNNLSPGPDPCVEWGRLGMMALYLLLSLLALVLNPNTTRMWVYPFQTAGMRFLQNHIQEWQSPNFHSLHTQPFIWMLLALVAAVGLSGRRVDGSDLVLTCGLACAALLARRNQAAFGLVVAPVLSRHLMPLLTNLERKARKVRMVRQLRVPHRPTTIALGMINWILLILLPALVISSAALSAPAQIWQRENLPVEAVEWIRTHRPAGKMFNHYNWGGYLIWRLWPDYRVFVDGRTYLYGDEFLLHQYMNASPETLDAWKVNLVLTRPDDPLVAHLACTDGWQETYHDEIAAIWTRTGER